MTFADLRLPLAAGLLFAIHGATVAHAQLETPAGVDFALTSSSSSSVLPDAPSASLLQQEPQTTPPADETPEQRKKRQDAEAEAQVKAEEKQRIGGVLPNFNTVIGGWPAPPITAKQKWNIAAHSAIDPYYFGLAFITAGLGEAEDSHPGYHWGAQGYFKRVGANFVDNLDGIIIGNALLPAVLHQDPRYFRKGKGSIPSRIVHSALSAVICRGDNGHQQFNFSNVGGNLIAGAISNVYYPSSETGVGLTFQNALQVTYVGAIGAQLLEFSPDISDWWHKRKERKKIERMEAGERLPSSTPQPAKP
ncbi:hypothetical protein [Granulicella rosea]|uniref:hypothetical protein n=1 Tax=Granulicella rosea TaxID=474952 RepID=UPI000B79A1AD|nr:hypothetical protein [Granulicella rosea]